MGSQTPHCHAQNQTNFVTEKLKVKETGVKVFFAPYPFKSHFVVCTLLSKFHYCVKLGGGAPD